MRTLNNEELATVVGGGPVTAVLTGAGIFAAGWYSIYHPQVLTTLIQQLPVAVAQFIPPALRGPLPAINFNALGPTAMLGGAVGLAIFVGSWMCRL